MKRCPQCETDKFENEFFKNKNPRCKGEEYSSWCKVCNRRRHRSRYYRKRKEVLLDKKNKRYKMSEEDRMRKRISRKAYNEKNREIVLDKLGNKCACCGEDEKLFLEIDHINNDGAQHRSRDTDSATMVRWLIKNNFPEGFQLLCSNCNMAKGRHGKCPHNN